MPAPAAHTFEIVDEPDVDFDATLPPSDTPPLTVERPTRTAGVRTTLQDTISRLGERRKQLAIGGGVVGAAVAAALASSGGAPAPPTASAQDAAPTPLATPKVPDPRPARLRAARRRSSHAEPAAPRPAATERPARAPRVAGAGAPASPKGQPVARASVPAPSPAPVAIGASAFDREFGLDG